MKKNKIHKVLAPSTSILFEKNIKLFPSFFAIFGKISVFEPLICGRRPPEHRAKFLGSQNIIVEHLKAETTSKNIFSILPAEFCPKPPFLPIFGWWRAFWVAGSSREPAGGLIKTFDNAFTTFKHPTIMLGWFNDPKGSSQQNLPPPKNRFFFFFLGGGGGGVNKSISI